MLRVIGVGFGRTGTASLKVALEQLGLGPCYHMFEIVEQPRRADDWIAATAGRTSWTRADWDRVFAGYQATVDWPATAFWRELVDAYPEAKVILTVRDPEQWYESASNTIFRFLRPSRNPLARAARWLAVRSNPGIRRFGPTIARLVWEDTFDGRFDDRAHATAVFERHTREVRRHVPADRLLVYEVRQGWGPLCAFLGVPAPDGPFPWTNDSETFLHQQRVRMLRTVSVPLGITAAALATGLLGILALRRRAR